MLLEVINLATITQIAQSGSSRRFSIYIFVNTLYNFAFYPDIVQPPVFLEVCAGSVLLEVVNLPNIANVLQKMVRHKGCQGT